MEITINGIKIEYIDTIEENSDKVCVCLHGWGACKENFLQTINLLKSKYRCVALDLPGFGKSSKLEKSFDVDEYADIVIDFIKNIFGENRKIIFFGHSFGGRIMIKISNRNELPFVIDKNIFIDSAGIKHELSFHKKMRVLIYKTMKNVLNIFPGSKEEKEKRLDKLKEKFGSSDYKNADNIMRETMVKAINEDLSGLLKNINSESLLIWGENDKDTPLEDGKMFEREIKNSGLVVLKNCGHFSFVEDSYTYLKVLESFLM